MSVGNYLISQSVNTIVCDIEGTTTSISFVKDTLFPYVREHLREYLENNFNSEECRQDINLLREQAIDDSKTNENVPIISEGFDDKEALINQVIKNVFWQMDADRKTKALKQLQGHIWKNAYENGLIKGHVYDDVVPAFEKWKKKGFEIFIYSSGSIDAQKMLFGFSEKGNILNFFSGHFDTTIGPKIEPSSYHNILAKLNKDKNEVLFLTDLIKEAEAAQNVGIHVCLLRRNDNPDKETKNFQYVTNFDEII